MPSPVVPETAHEPLPAALEQILSPVALGTNQETSPAASEQMPSPACDGYVHRMNMTKVITYVHAHR